MQWANPLTLGAESIGSTRLRQCMLGIVECPRLHLGLERGNALKARGDQLLRARLATGDARRRLRSGEIGKIAVGQVALLVDGQTAVPMRPISEASGKASAIDNATSNVGPTAL